LSINCNCGVSTLVCLKSVLALSIKMEDDYDEYRRWDGDVDVEVSFVKLLKLSPIVYLHCLSYVLKKNKQF